MIRLSIFIVSVFLILVGCGEQNKKADNEAGEVAALKKEVIVIHDTAMAKMNRIFQLRTQLEDQLDSADLDQEMVSAIRDLKSADEAMMQWMRNFSKNYGMVHGDVHAGNDTLPSNDEILAGLQNEKTKILKVKEQMESSIAQAERILEK